MKDVELVDKKAHKEIQGFAAWLTRNARNRLSPRFSGTGPKLVVTLTLDPRGLRQEGGLFSARWWGSAALDVAFRTEAGASVAKVAVEAPTPRSGHLEPAGDLLLDDLLAFIAAP